MSSARLRCEVRYAWDERRRTAVHLGAALLMTWCGRVAAMELDYGLGLLEERSSNIGRTSENEVSARTGSVLAGLALEENSAELVAMARAQAEHRNYRPDVYDDGGLYYVDAGALWLIFPQRFTWSVADRYDYGLLDPNEPYTPTNRTSYNVFETGPDYYVRLDTLNTLAFGARLGKMDYGDLEASNRRLGATVRWIHQATPATGITAAYGHTDVEYEGESTSRDFTRRDAFLRLDSRQGRMRLTLDAGYTRIDREPDETNKGPLFHIAWTSQLTSESAAGIFGAIEHMDAGALALGAVTDPLSVSEPRPIRASAVTDVATGDTFEFRSVEGFYETFGGAVEWELRAFRREFDFDNVPEDRIERGGSTELRYGFSGTFGGAVFGRQTHTEFADVEQSDRETEVGARLSYRATREITVGAETRRTKRSSTVGTAEFEDRRYLISLMYSSGPLFTPASRR